MSVAGAGVMRWSRSIAPQFPAGCWKASSLVMSAAPSPARSARRSAGLRLADQRSIFLDEIGDIPLELQPKLLRVLQEREYERLGSTQTRQVDVRVVAATHRNLSEMILQRQFRSDLYYRLNVFPICIPPLRERGDSASGAAFCPAVCPRDEQDHQRNLRGNNGGSHPIFVAGQHSRTAKCN